MTTTLRAELEALCDERTASARAIPIASVRALLAEYPEPHVVTSVEELEALPPKTVVSVDGWLYVRDAGEDNDEWLLLNFRDRTLGVRNTLGKLRGMSSRGLLGGDSPHGSPIAVLTPTPAPRATATREQAKALAKHLESKRTEGVHPYGRDCSYKCLPDAIMALLTTPAEKGGV